MGLNKHGYNRFEAVSREKNSILTNGSEPKKKDVLDQKLDAIEKKLGYICEHIELSNKKLAQNVIDLDNNVDQKVNGMERKIDVLLQTVINGQRTCEDNATKKVYETVTVSSINRFAAKMSKDANQTNSNIGKSTNFLVNNTTPDELKQNLEGKREKHRGERAGADPSPTLLLPFRLLPTPA